MANENGVSKGKIFFGSAIVIIVLGLLLAWIFGAFAPSVPIETKRITKTQTQSWKKSVDKRLTNHEKRIKDLEARVEKHADAISDLANAQLDNENDQLDQEPKETAKKLRKYTNKGWDYPDFPENW